MDEKENKAAEEPARQNGLFVNKEHKMVRIDIFFGGEDSIRNALGTIEMGKDMVKKIFSDWIKADQEKKGIFTIGSNGSGNFSRFFRRH